MRPDSSFLGFFKQALLYTSPSCTDSTCCNFFDEDAPWRSSAQQDAQAPAVSGLKYPLVLFEDLQDLPPVSVLYEMSDRFHSQYLPGLCFLPQLSCLAAETAQVPFHLLLSKAILGASGAGSTQPQKSANDALWRACASLLTGSVEVDNSQGMKITWLSSV